MKVSLNWLKEYVDLEGVEAEEIAEALPMLGLEVESVESLGLKKLDNVVVGEILSRIPHPDSDHLGICSVKVSEGGEPLQIVCGASNYKVGDRVPVALPGAVLPTPDGKGFAISVSKLRGVESSGMMCSARELGLGEDHSGLLILSGRPKIGTPINDVFPDTDTVFEIELTANRGDCLSHIGVARELAARFGKELKKPALKYSPEYSGEADGEILKSVELKTPDCPLYLAVSIKGVKIKESPDWMKRRLEAVGLRPINNVVDVTNFVLMEYGQPLHSFDADKIRGKKIIVRKAFEGEHIRTLDDKEYSLSPQTTLICDAEGGVAMAGVMGGLNSEVEDSTKNLVIESAWFNPGNTRATSRRYGINTDSSYRFARDVDPQSTFDASRRAVDLILELAGGEVLGKTCLKGEAPRGTKEIKIDRDFIVGALGFDVPPESISDIFKRLGFGVEETGESKWTVSVPSFRCDVYRPIDLVEEFVRLWGTDKIPETPFVSPASLRDDDPLFKYEKRAADYLSSIGFNECVNYTLRDSSKQSGHHARIDFLKLANPLTSDQDSLRASLLDGLFDNLLLNISNGNEITGVFENGKIFRPDENGEICELASTAFAFFGDSDERSWKKRESPDFFTAKKIAFDVLGILGVDASRLNFAPSGELVWQPGYSATCGSERREGFSVSFGASNIGVMRKLGISKPIFAGEICFKQEVAGRKKASEKFAPFSSFPAASRDIALIVPKAAKASDVESDILKIAKQKTKGSGFSLESAKLFDLYEGKGIEDGFKSLAYALSFRSADRTLLTDEVNKVFDAVCEELSKKYKLRA